MTRLQSSTPTEGYRKPAAHGDGADLRPTLFPLRARWHRRRGRPRRPRSVLRGALILDNAARAQCRARPWQRLRQGHASSPPRCRAISESPRNVVGRDRRDHFVRECCALAQDALPRKNSLIAEDAKLVEDAFETRLSELAASEGAASAGKQSSPTDADPVDTPVAQRARRRRCDSFRKS
jgi:hypothetical protein